MTPEILVLLMFGCLFAGIFLGYPTAFVLGGVAMIFGFVNMGPDIFGLFITRLFGLMKNYTLLAVPLFLFMGVFMEKSGVARRLFHAMHLLWGGMRGGLGISTIAISALFAAATGVVGASEVTIGLMALPAMLSRDYDKSLACGSVCAGGTLGILIPPSIMIVIYGPIARISVGKLFLGALVPGILLSLLYMLYIAVRCYFRPQDGPPMPREERDVPLRKKLLLLVTSVFPPGLLIFAVLGSIFFGVAAVTEAAAVGVIASMLLAACYGRLDFPTVRDACTQTLTITSMILMIAIGASFFSSVFVALGGDEVISSLFLNLPFGKWGILLTIMGLLVIVGMFIDWMGIVFIIVPLITPIGAELGFDPVWFAVMVMVNLQISFLTPPFAYSIFYLKGITPPEVQTTDIYRGVLPFVGMQVLALALCVIFPILITWLPGHLIK
ncbi:C4-dicarboxylate ABC transporter [Desulfonema ishimotonii]|uniref:C4-dicarboxylate ABC transporter n=1 Tax=Desulfonema ishimotonii TaxID=45657 RepID=A0A401FWJ4_9BACT|nr:TRAP transporter large permease subunit [Desulfonema ishimotonii]GBC61313.1 C4-dicarboxylate ABC transporter [Desulfonema ishimotonii]